MFDKDIVRRDGKKKSFRFLTAQFTELSRFARLHPFILSSDEHQEITQKSCLNFILAVFPDWSMYRGEFLTDKSRI